MQVAGQASVLRCLDTQHKDAYVDRPAADEAAPPANLRGDCRGVMSPGVSSESRRERRGERPKASSQTRCHRDDVGVVCFVRSWPIGF